MFFCTVYKNVMSLKGLIRSTNSPKPKNIKLLWQETGKAANL